jgi:hypothetical protein
VVEPDSKGGLAESSSAEVRQIEGNALAPTQRYELFMNVRRRIAFVFRRLVRETATRASALCQALRYVGECWSVG